MKTINFLLLMVSFFIISCEENETDQIAGSLDGFSIISNDKVVLHHNDIHYYDYSTHLIYLKKNNSFLQSLNETADFSVYADGVEIYSGQTLPGYSSFLPFGAVIRSQPSFYKDYIISIDFIQFRDSLGNVDPDLRKDPRIIEALKKYNQYHSGLDCDMVSVQYTSPDKLTIALQLSNNDTFNYYYLDPDKMGSNLFHYFTNGLIIWNFKNKKSFTNHIVHAKPEPWNSWDSDWLSLIKSNESKIITITYDSFDDIPSGQYEAFFEFPGLSYQIDKEDIARRDGRIWLGKLDVKKEITIE